MYATSVPGVELDAGAEEDVRFGKTEKLVEMDGGDEILAGIDETTDALAPDAVALPLMLLVAVIVALDGGGSIDEAVESDAMLVALAT